MTTNMLLGGGLAFPAAPGSIIAVTAAAAGPAAGGIGNLLVVYLSVGLAAAVSFVLTAVILRASRARDLLNENAGDLSAAISKTEANKGKKSSVLGTLAGGEAVDLVAQADVGAGAALRTKTITNIVFACDAGMGSSAMGASVLRNKIKKEGIDGITVVNKAIANLTPDADLIITQQTLTDRARGVVPGALHVSVDNFMNSPKYDEVLDLLREQAGNAPDAPA